jgi:hypothetical protein
VQRLVYDATVDDALDVAWRLAYRSQAFRKQMHANVVIAGVASGVVFSGYWLYTSGLSLVNVVFATVAGVLFGIVFAALFRRFFDKEFRKQHRKMIAEQFGGKPAIQCEIELRPDAVWTRQAGMEMIFPWAGCTGVKNNSEDIELTFSLGICVIRNRYFASPADRDAFLDAARRLSAKTGE